MSRNKRTTLGPHEAQAHDFVQHCELKKKKILPTQLSPPFTTFPYRPQQKDNDTWRADEDCNPRGQTPPTGRPG